MVQTMLTMQFYSRADYNIQEERNCFLPYTKQGSGLLQNSLITPFELKEKHVFIHFMTMGQLIVI